MTVEGRQVLKVIDGIEQVSRQLDDSRRRIAETADRPTRGVLAGGLESQVERLSNLVSLAATVDARGLPPDVRRRLEACLAGLHRLVARICTNLCVDGLRRLRDRAETVADGGALPIGVGDRVRGRYRDLVTTLELVSNGLTETEEEDVRATAAAVNRLIALERRLDVLKVVAGPPPPEIGPVTVPRLARLEGGEGPGGGAG